MKVFYFVISIMFIVFLAGPLGVLAQAGNCKPIDFDLAPTYQMGANTFSYTMADFNSDGKIDVAAINVNSNTVSVAYGDGFGGFGPPQTFSTTLNPFAVTSGDLNNDSKPDLIAASFIENKFAILINDGNGGFLAPTIYLPPTGFPNQGEYFDLKTGDFNGDGNLDVIAIENQSNKQLRILLGNGHGSLTLTSSLNVTGNEAQIAVGFINSDNISDIIVTRQEFSSRAVLWVTGRTDGNFSLSPSFTMTDRPASVSIADLNNDGKNDLAISVQDTTTPTLHSIQTWLGGGDGSFILGGHVDLQAQFPPSGITTSDFDNDGKIDFAVYIASGVRVYSGNGNGTFEDPRDLAVPSGSTMLFSSDLNADGHPDLITGQTQSIPTDGVAVLLNDGTGNFNAPSLVLDGEPNIIAADMNNDSLLDIVATTPTSFVSPSEIFIATNQASRRFSPDLVFDTPASLSSIAVGDVNGDGKKDVITSHASNARLIATYLGDGTGNIAAPITTSRNPGVSNLVAGDFNEDGKDDLFIVDENGRGSTLISTGDGHFTAVPDFSIDSISGQLPLMKGDFNGDGHTDLAIFSGSSIAIWKGSGDGKFTSGGSNPLLNGIQSAAVGDINGDGKLDIAIMGPGVNATINILIGDGNGGFSASAAVGGFIDQGSSIVAGDFNNDGTADLAFVSAGNQGNLVIVPSKTQLPFLSTPQFYWVAGASQTTLFAADYEGDGRVDIGFSNRSTSRGVFYNKSGDESCLSVNDVTITEGGSGTTNASFTVTLANPSSQGVRVNYSIGAGRTTLGSDLQNVSGRLLIPAGKTTATINVPIIGDQIDEFDETFAVNLASPSNAALTKSIGLGMILDDDPEPNLTVSNVSSPEGSFATQFVFTASLSAPSGKPIGFNWATADGTATSGTDYLTIGTTASITPGATSTAFAVTVLGDNTFEPDETFLINLANPSNVAIANTQAIGTIVNDDPVPTLNIFGTSVTEGNSGTTSRAVSVQLSNPSYLPVTLNVLTSDGTAIAGQDFVASDTPISIPAGQLSLTSNIQIIGDTIDEPNETFFVNSYNVANATQGTTQAQVLIVDDDPLPALSIGSVAVTEGGVGSSMASVPVTLLAASGKEVRVNYSTINGTAISPLDYAATSGTLIFAPGETSKTIPVPIVGDQIIEPDETFQVSLSAPINATISASSANVTIINDDHSSDRADFDGDGKTDLSVFRPSDGNWYALKSDGGVLVTSWGAATDTTVPGDYDHDGKADMAVYRPSSGQWFILRSSDFTVNVVGWGAGGDVPTAGDFDGDGKADEAVYRPSAGQWFVFRSSDNGASIINWGNATDVPVQSDYDGDGKTDVAVFRPSTGQWFLFRSTDGPLVAGWGIAGDKPVEADYDGDNKDDIAVYRPSDGNWYIFRSSDSSASIVNWGNATDVPVPGDYDGDGKDDEAIYRDGTWFVLQSTAGVLVANWGVAGDIPIPAKYIP